MLLTSLRYLNQRLKMQRILISPLAKPERIILDWLVVRMPMWVTSDGLTALGVLGSFLTCLGYILTWNSPQFLWLASFGIVMNWFGDSLDGSLARYRQMERPRYGFLLDQTIDVFGNILVGVGMASSPYIRLETAFLAFTGYHMLTISSLVRAALDRTFHVTLSNMGPTEIRALIILTNVLILMFGAPQWIAFGVSFAWCDITVGLFGVGFFFVFFYLLYTDAKRLRADDDAARKNK